MTHENTALKLHGYGGISAPGPNFRVQGIWPGWCQLEQQRSCLRFHLAAPAG